MGFCNEKNMSQYLVLVLVLLILVLGYFVSDDHLFIPMLILHLVLIVFLCLFIIAIE